MLKPYPISLTTSDWVDYLVGLSREDQIAALATYHRRIEFDSKKAALNNLAPAVATLNVATPALLSGDTVTAIERASADPHEVVAAARDAALASLSAPQDYWSS